MHASAAVCKPRNTKMYMKRTMIQQLIKIILVLLSGS